MSGLARILAISDIHDNTTAFRDILSLTNFDMVVLAGDISELKPSEFFQVVSRIQKPTIIIHGNHDCHWCLRKIAEKLDFVYYVRRGLINLEVGGEEFTILGVSGIYSKRGGNPLYFTDRQLIRLISEIHENDVKVDIAISHTPPRYCADFLPKGGRGGLKQLLALVDTCEPKFWISGHTHVLAVEKRGESIAINCGSGYDGDFILIDTKSKKVVTSRLFLEIDEAEQSRELEFLFAMRKTQSMNRLHKSIAREILTLLKA